MKIVIDFPDNVFERFSKGDYDLGDWETTREAITNGTVLPIPDNPTNGDMIKALFPNGVISYGRTRVYYSHYPNGTFDFHKNWWDTPWKGERNEANN